MDYGIQLYSVAYYMGKDVKGTLRKLSEMGFTKVEPAGFFGVAAEDFKAWCDEFGLTVCGAHCGFGDLEGDNFSKMVKYLKTIGCKRYIIPWENSEDAAAIDSFIANIKKYQPMLAAEGIELAFHNHSGEFCVNKDGQIPHIELQKRSDIKFQIDIYWSYRGGVKPLYVLEQLKDRLVSIHLKDGDMQNGKPLGMGTAPVAEALAWARKNNMDIVVENECSSDEVSLDEAKICIDYLKSLEK